MRIAMLLTGRILGGLIIAVLLAIIIGESVAGVRQNSFDSEAFYVIVPTAIVLAGYAVSWWRELAGGIIMMAGYLVFSFSPSVLSLVSGDAFQFYPGIWLFTLPVFLSGAAFVLATVHSRRLAA